VSARFVLEQTPCPECGDLTLYFGMGFRARPLGSFSLAGMQDKVSAQEIPVIRCRTCEFVKFPKE
jgi:hypothetical protein